MKRTALSIFAALALSGCSASYQSPRTGIQYRLEVPFSAISPYLTPAPQK